MCISMALTFLGEDEEPTKEPAEEPTEEPTKGTCPSLWWFNITSLQHLFINNDRYS